MTASGRREVDANLLRGAAPGSAQARAKPQDAGGEDLGDLVEALGRGHEVGVEGVSREMAGQWRIIVHAIYLPTCCAECRVRVSDYI
jgi:hypothetical protein